MDQKNFIVAIVLSVLIIVGWQSFFPTKHTTPPPAPVTQAAPGTPATTPGAGVAAPAAPGATPAAGAETFTARPEALAKNPRVTFSTPERDARRRD